LKEACHLRIHPVDECFIRTHEGVN
jgi:hypothetical protein